MLRHGISILTRFHVYNVCIPSRKVYAVDQKIMYLFSVRLNAASDGDNGGHYTPRHQSCGCKSPSRRDLNGILFWLLAHSDIAGLLVQSPLYQQCLLLTWFGRLVVNSFRPELYTLFNEQPWRLGKRCFAGYAGRFCPRM